MNVNVDEELDKLMARYLAKDSKHKRGIDDMMRNMKWAYEGRVEDLAEIALSVLFYKMMKVKGVQ